MSVKANNQTQNKLTDDEKELCKVLHEKHINSLHSASQAYDRAILSLSTAILGYTIGFIEISNHFRHFNNMWLLSGTWILLLLSILFILLSFLADQCVFRSE